MKRSQYTDQQVAFALQQAEAGAAVPEVCRKMGISEATFYRWKQKYGGLMPSEVQRLRACLRIQGCAILRRSRAPIASSIMASETSRRFS